uniref:Interaptin-like n=1 Tax=Saccoglossus kowalevskii TaxID=10224 RepID=A0ABM0M954_SACKO|nr:PREDICTED: interaptin-like [Saccoglossus kowalevskii]
MESADKQVSDADMYWVHQFRRFVPSSGEAESSITPALKDKLKTQDLNQQQEKEEKLSLKEQRCDATVEKLSSKYVQTEKNNVCHNILVDVHNSESRKQYLDSSEKSSTVAAPKEPVSIHRLTPETSQQTVHTPKLKVSHQPVRGAFYSQLSVPRNTVTPMASQAKTMQKITRSSELFVKPAQSPQPPTCTLTSNASQGETTQQSTQSSESCKNPAQSPEPEVSYKSTCTVTSNASQGETTQQSTQSSESCKNPAQSPEPEVSYQSTCTLASNASQGETTQQSTQSSESCKNPAQSPEPEVSYQSTCTLTSNASEGETTQQSTQSSESCKNPAQSPEPEISYQSTCTLASNASQGETTQQSTQSSESCKNPAQSPEPEISYKSTCTLTSNASQGETTQQSTHSSESCKNPAQSPEPEVSYQSTCALTSNASQGETTQQSTQSSESCKNPAQSPEPEVSYQSTSALTSNASQGETTQQSTQLSEPCKNPAQSPEPEISYQSTCTLTSNASQGETTQQSTQSPESCKNPAQSPEPEISYQSTCTLASNASQGETTQQSTQLSEPCKNPAQSSTPEVSYQSTSTLMSNASKQPEQEESYVEIVGEIISITTPGDRQDSSHETSKKPLSKTAAGPVPPAVGPIPIKPLPPAKQDKKSEIICIDSDSDSDIEIISEHKSPSLDDFNDQYWMLQSQRFVKKSSDKTTINKKKKHSVKSKKNDGTKKLVKKRDVGKQNKASKAKTKKRKKGNEEIIKRPQRRTRWSSIHQLKPPEKESLIGKEVEGDVDEYLAEKCSDSDSDSDWFPTSESDSDSDWCPKRPKDKLHNTSLDKKDQLSQINSQTEVENNQGIGTACVLSPDEQSKKGDTASSTLSPSSTNNTSLKSNQKKQVSSSFSDQTVTRIILKTLENNSGTTKSAEGTLLASEMKATSPAKHSSETCLDPHDMINDCKLAESPVIQSEESHKSHGKCIDSKHSENQILQQNNVSHKNPALNEPAEDSGTVQDYSSDEVQYNNNIRNDVHELLNEFSPSNKQVTPGTSEMTSKPLQEVGMSDSWVDQDVAMDDYWVDQVQRFLPKVSDDTSCNFTKSPLKTKKTVKQKKVWPQEQISKKKHVGSESTSTKPNINKNKSLDTSLKSMKTTAKRGRGRPRKVSTEQPGQQNCKEQLITTFSETFKNTSTMLPKKELSLLHNTHKPSAGPEPFETSALVETSSTILKTSAIKEKERLQQLCRKQPLQQSNEPHHATDIQPKNITHSESLPPGQFETATQKRRRGRPCKQNKQESKKQKESALGETIEDASTPSTKEATCSEHIQTEANKTCYPKLTAKEIKAFSHGNKLPEIKTEPLEEEFVTPINDRELDTDGSPSAGYDEEKSDLFHLLHPPNNDQNDKLTETNSTDYWINESHRFVKPKKKCSSEGGVELDNSYNTQLPVVQNLKYVQSFQLEHEEAPQRQGTAELQQKRENHQTKHEQQSDQHDPEHNLVLPSPNSNYQSREQSQLQIQQSSCSIQSIQQSPEQLADTFVKRQRQIDDNLVETLLQQLKQSKQLLQMYSEQIQNQQVLLQKLQDQQQQFREQHSSLSGEMQPQPQLHVHNQLQQDLESQLQNQKDILFQQESQLQDILDKNALDEHNVKTAKDNTDAQMVYIGDNQPVMLDSHVEVQSSVKLSLMNQYTSHQAQASRQPQHTIVSDQQVNAGAVQQLTQRQLQFEQQQLKENLIQHVPIDLPQVSLSTQHIQQQMPFNQQEQLINQLQQQERSNVQKQIPIHNPHQVPFNQHVEQQQMQVNQLQHQMASNQQQMPVWQSQQVGSPSNAYNVNRIPTNQYEQQVSVTPLLQEPRSVCQLEQQMQPATYDPLINQQNQQQSITQHDGVTQLTPRQSEPLEQWNKAEALKRLLIERRQTQRNCQPGQCLKQSVKTNQQSKEDHLLSVCCQKEQESGAWQQQLRSTIHKDKGSQGQSTFAPVQIHAPFQQQQQQQQPIPNQRELYQQLSPQFSSVNTFSSKPM